MKISFKKNEGVTDEAKIKKIIFNSVRPNLSIPPLNLHLKNQKISFSTFLKKIMGV